MRGLLRVSAGPPESAAGSVFPVAVHWLFRSLLKQVWVGNGRSSRPPQPKSPRVCGPPLRHVTADAPAHPPTARRASGVKPSTAGTPPSSRGRKAHNCSPSGGTGGVSPGRAEAHAEDARSALTRRSARSYLRPTSQPATAPVPRSQPGIQLSSEPPFVSRPALARRTNRPQPTHTCFRRAGFSGAWGTMSATVAAPRYARVAPPSASRAVSTAARHGVSPRRWLRWGGPGRNRYHRYRPHRRR